MYAPRCAVAPMRNVFRKVTRLSVHVTVVMMAIPLTGSMAASHCQHLAKLPVIVRAIRIVRTVYANVSTNQRMLRNIIVIVMFMGFNGIVVMFFFFTLH